MLHTVILVTLAGLVAAEFDQELDAKYQTMPKSSFIEYFNAHNYSWKMAEYDNIDEKYIPCDNFDKESWEKLPLQTHDLEEIDLPVNFDARVKWPRCKSIKEIYDQGNCGSCWAFGTATTASDRTCIHKNKHIRLSEEDFECMQKGVCAGGNSHKAFIFWKRNGLVTRECKPYDIQHLLKKQCKTRCVHSKINYKHDKHFAKKVYRISSNSHQIKAELVKNGPIQVSFTVFKDLFHYKSGVYEHHSGGRAGGHSARIIGYGVEHGIHYWLVANSWGSSWGEHGFFKIKSYQKGVDFENQLTSGLPK